MEITKSKIWTFMAGAGSAVIMVLAFFIPSLQDQWDRHQSRKVVEQYENLGNDFYDEEKYDMAEQAYERAFDLSDNKRLDLEILRLKAKINTINMNSTWGAEPPEDLEEVDFQYVLHLQKGKEHEKERVETLNSYGIFLVGLKKQNEAKKQFLEAIKLDPNDATGLINMANLYSEISDNKLALDYYLKAKKLDNNNARLHYNLGLLFLEEGNKEEAKTEFTEALRIDPSEPDAKIQLEQIDRNSN